MVVVGGVAVLLVVGRLVDRREHLDAALARRGKGEFITYLVGAAAAYRWASDRETRLFCPTTDAKLDGRTWAQIALAEYKRNKDEYASLKEYPLSVFALALLHGLQSKYPCASEEPAAAAATGANTQAGKAE